MTDIFSFQKGGSPLLVSMPHDGTRLPREIAARMTAAAKSLPDTDWHVRRLYDFLENMDVSIIAATHSRYVIDLNRPADGAALYPGQDETGLCPVTTFAGEAIYREAAAPGEAEIRARIKIYWRPYHDAIAAELARLKSCFGYAILWDAHSIRSRVSRFFEDRLPDLNLGTADGASCAGALEASLFRIAGQSDYGTALNGRFKGGYITRNYGDPANGIHAVQLEIAQDTYMDEDAPFAYRTDKAAHLQPVLKAMIQTAMAFRP